VAWLEHFLQDVRYALRGLRRSPGFAATVIATLGLGIGANLAIFSVVDRLMFRPFPHLRDPVSVHRVYLKWNDRGTVRTDAAFEYTRYLDLRRWTSSFSQYAAFADRLIAVGVGEAARERRVAMVSASLFEFFDAPPALGRYFLAAEDTTPRGADVAVLGHGYWKAEFGGRDVTGEVLQVGNMNVTVVGVAPEGFAGVRDGDPPAIYIPITTYAWAAAPSEDDRSGYYTRYNWGWMAMMVRRKAGVTPEQASADLSRAYVRSWDAEQELSPFAPSSVAQPEAVAGATRVAAGPDPGAEARTSLWVSGVALIVLLIACANVANLFLARAIRRRREVAVRLALGVSRTRLAMQTVTESLVLAGLGAIVGLIVAQWGGAGIRRLLVAGAGASLEVFTDWRTLAVAVAAALVAGLLTGLVPALLGSRGDLAGSLKSGSREGTYHRSRTRTGLLVLQGALSVVLLVGAGLFVRSLDNVRAMRMGYDAEPVLLAARNLRGMRLDDSAQVRLGRELLAAAQALPNVERAAWVSSVPFWSTSATSLFVAGIDSVRRLGRFTYQTATTDYFAAMGTRILRGRGFTSEDHAASPRVVVVSESMAAVLWPGRDALGECLRVSAESAPCSTVIGIAEDMVQREITGTQRFHYYMPIEQYQPTSGFALLLRMRGDPAQQVESVRSALQRVMPGQAYVVVRPFKDLVEGQMRSWRLGSTMFVAFGVLALVVAAVGLYGAIGYNVTQRMHELGVRIALGARSPDIVRLVVGQGLVFAASGVTLGLALAWLAGRWVEPLLFRQPARDPLVFGVVGVVLVVVAVVASAMPAFRATRADPNTALRAD
jgi:putative ABC transport system permease protein